MDADQCEQPLIEHRDTALNPAGASPRTRKVMIYECPNPDCSAEPQDHGTSLPCRWSWKMAHGKQYNGMSFPVRRCPGCQHIRRAGKPAEIEMSGS